MLCEFYMALTLPFVVIPTMAVASVIVPSLLFTRHYRVTNKKNRNIIQHVALSLALRTLFMMAHFAEVANCHAHTVADKFAQCHDNANHLYQMAMILSHESLKRKELVTTDSDSDSDMSSESDTDNDSNAIISGNCGCEAESPNEVGAERGYNDNAAGIPDESNNAILYPTIERKKEKMDTADVGIDNDAEVASDAEGEFEL